MPIHKGKKHKMMPGGMMMKDSEHEAMMGKPKKKGKKKK